MDLLSLVASLVLGVLLVQGVDGVDKKSITKEIATHRNKALINKDICGISSKRSLGPPFQVPWMALLVYNTSRGVVYSCGGTVISERYVLTAAHCVRNLPRYTRLVGVRLGEYDYADPVDCARVEGQVICADPPIDAGIEKIVPHNGYTQKSFRHNIALLRLNQIINFSSDSIRPICLPMSPEEQQRYFHEGELLTVVGWGTTSTGVQSSVVRPVHVEFVPTDDCAAAYRNFTRRIHIFEDQLCLRGTTKGDATSGDGGGPLVAGGFETLDKVTQYGIVSFGPSSGMLNPPGVYTHVGSYLKWILDHMDATTTRETKPKN